MAKHKVLSLQVRNVMRVEAASVDTHGKNVVTVGGENGQGKSSFLNCIQFAVSGKKSIPSEPLRRGASRGDIVVDLGEIKITREFTKDESTLTVIAADGSKIKRPQELLDTLYNKLSFDPLAFTLMTAGEQLKMLRTLLGLDESLDAEEAKAQAARKIAKRDADNAKALCDAATSYPGVPDKPVSVADLSTQVLSASEHNQRRDGMLQVISTSKDTIVSSEQRIAKLLAEIDELEGNINTANEEIAFQEDLLKKTPLIDIAAIQEELLNAEETNKKVAANAKRAELFKASMTAKTKADACEEAVEVVRQKKRDAIENAKFPVAGLGFGDGCVTYNGIPFDQASMAEQMRVSVGIAAAMAPDLRVCLVRDGSLLDNKSMALLGQLAEEHDLQVWVEMVRSDEPCTVQIVDGQSQ